MFISGCLTGCVPIYNVRDQSRSCWPLLPMCRPGCCRPTGPKRRCQMRASPSGRMPKEVSCLWRCVFGALASLVEVYQVDKGIVWSGRVLFSQANRIIGLQNKVERVAMRNTSRIQRLASPKHGEGETQRAPARNSSLPT